MGTLSPLDNMSVCESEISAINQLDGNASVCSDISDNNINRTKSNSNYRVNNASVAHHLPVVTVCNMHSFSPKVNNFKNDFVEREVDISLLCEVWQKTEDKKPMSYIEEMLQMEGLKYFSTSRPRGKRGEGQQ